MNKRFVDLDNSANIGRTVKAGTKKTAFKKPSPKKNAAAAKKAATKPAAKSAVETPTAAESAPAPKPMPNKVANSGKAYQPTLPGMRSLRQFKEPSGK